MHIDPVGRKMMFLIAISLFPGCEATTDDASKNTPLPIFEKLKPLDLKLDEPQPGEWLFVHKEKGQLFEQYTGSDPVRPTAIAKKIYLQPLGTFTDEQLDVIQYTSDYLRIFFDLEVVILPTQSDNMVPDSVRRNLGTNAEQLLTISILDYLQKNIPKDGLVIMAVTSKDLYPHPSYNFVFGQARTKERVGVSSIYRYSTEPIDKSNYSICLERLMKTSSHEITHMLSCQHCTYGVCVMNGSNSLSESDMRPNRLCSECHKKLQWNLGFDVKKRLENLELYFSKHKLTRDQKLAARDLAAIN